MAIDSYTIALYGFLFFVICMILIYFDFQGISTYLFPKDGPKGGSGTKGGRLAAGAAFLGGKDIAQGGSTEFRGGAGGFYLDGSKRPNRQDIIDHPERYPIETIDALLHDHKMSVEMVMSQADKELLKANQHKVEAKRLEKEIAKDKQEFEDYQERSAKEQEELKGRLKTRFQQEVHDLIIKQAEQLSMDIIMEPNLFVKEFLKSEAWAHNFFWDGISAEERHDTMALAERLRDIQTGLPSQLLKHNYGWGSMTEEEELEVQQLAERLAALNDDGPLPVFTLGETLAKMKEISSKKERREKNIELTEENREKYGWKGMTEAEETELEEFAERLAALRPDKLTSKIE